MATYTSTGTGDWNTAATWGGAGYPSVNDDIVNIAAGHVVTYNAGDSAVTWGNVTVTGTLTFPINANSTMSFNATGILAVAATGVLNAGTSSAPIGAAYHCRIYWPQGATARNVLTTANGATVNCYGAPAFYGSAPTAELHDDWSSTQTLYITGDYTAKWVAGQKFWIHKNGSYSDYATDSAIFAIASVGAYDSGNNRTPITISEAAPGVLYDAVNATSGWTSKLLMLSRNVEMSDPGSDWVINSSYTERIQASIVQAAPNARINFNYCLMRGWNYAPPYSGKCIKITSCVYVNNSRVHGTGSIFNDCCFIGLGTYGFYIGSVNIFENCYFVGNISAVTNGNIPTFIASNFIGNDIASSVNFDATFFGCRFICNKDPITTDYRTLVIDSDFWLNQTPSVYASTTYYDWVTLENCEIAGVKRALRVYEKVGNFLPLVSGDSHWQTPGSGSSWVLEATPTAYIGTGDFNKMVMSPKKEMVVYCPAGSNTLTFKIYPYGWTTALTNTDVYIKIRYLTDTGNETAETQTTTATFNNDAWRSMSVTFTTGQAGPAYFNVYVTKYESGAYFLIDPVRTLS